MLALTNMTFSERLTIFSQKLVKHVHQQGVIWLLVIALLTLIQANYRLAVNQTPSLSYKLFLICLHDSVSTGDFIAFTWHHGKPYPDGVTFVKRLLASTGDKVIKQGRVFIIGNVTLYAQEVGLTGRQLYANTQLKEGRNEIAPGKYFVAGDHPYSLDSRYNLLGLVEQSEVIGRAYPLF